jgi:hypothetical protein
MPEILANMCHFYITSMTLSGDRHSLTDTNKVIMDGIGK